MGKSYSNNYRLWATSAGQGTPVVMVHGAFSDFRYWEPQQITFGRRRKAISISLRGYYPDEGNGQDAQISAEQHIEELGSYLQSLTEPSHLLGHSRGGRIALHVAARFPENVRTLTLAEPGGIMAVDLLPSSPSAQEKPAGSIDIRQSALRLIRQGDIESGLQLYLDSGHGAGAWDRSPSIFKRVAFSNAGSIAGMIVDQTAALSSAAATRVHAPTLLIGGQKSPTLFKKILDALAESIPDARRVTIENADHFFTLTAQDEFDRAVEAFWWENEAK